MMIKPFLSHRILFLVFLVLWIFQEKSILYRFCHRLQTFYTHALQVDFDITIWHSIHVGRFHDMGGSNHTHCLWVRLIISKRIEYGWAWGKVISICDIYTCPILEVFNDIKLMNWSIGLIEYASCQCREMGNQWPTFAIVCL